MSTKVEQAQPSGHLHHRLSEELDLPPQYDQGEALELETLTQSNSSKESLPQYDAIDDVQAGSSSSAAALSMPGIHATHALQVEAQGHRFFAVAFKTRDMTIPIYDVTPEGNLGDLKFQSIRASRASGSCVLVRHGDNITSSPICTTTYRFGPNRPPHLRFHGVCTGPGGEEEDFKVESAAFHTRSQNIRTHLGTFQWRYAGRQERREANANNLLVLDKITTVALAGGKKTEQSRKKIAQLVRSDEFRAEGAGASSAGNGGRLLMDLRSWADTKGEIEQMEAFVVASCIVMLKKEVDRRKMQQVAMMSAAAGGG